MKKYCVIGAGAAGMSALNTLLENGHEVDCFEKNEVVGGHWNTDYDALHLITSRDQTHFEDFPMPGHYPHFPRRDQISDYLHSYGRERGLLEHISFNTEVLSVTPVATDGAVGSAGWVVTTTRGSDTYEGVLVANGHLWDKKVPQISGTFDGPQIHSGDYQNVGDIEGTRVLVVGAGNSGCDLAVDVAQHRLEADIVVRHGSYFQPKMYFGQPRSELAFLKEFKAEEQDLIARLLARVSIGENSNYPNLPVPKHQSLAEGATVVNDLLLYWIHHGRVRVVGHGVERFEGKKVHFTDGSVREYDTILYATGFHSTLPFLDNELVPRSNGAPVRYAGGIIPEGLEKLYYIGMIAPRGPQIPIYGVQSRIVARMLELHAAAPEENASLAAYFAQLQEPEDRIDIPRHFWDAQITDTNRLIEAMRVSIRA
ncbi:dimethylaniline monooxygenase [Arthrobacter sp. MYb227]|uniref:flavin-containing monooxygenase n=1 Tax=Arthrobacter sp. MYb227 TaxID=1848601 RepID=UPI000CFCB7F0|nr:NAD(P)-binding domain-containing protein [Arthrobacter sp. MYb227]PQZ94849.1 dimethylaniline monooxygenase [Arthrobacter sp. MYb227]